MSTIVTCLFQEYNAAYKAYVLMKIETALRVAAKATEQTAKLAGRGALLACVIPLFAADTSVKLAAGVVNRLADQGREQDQTKDFNEICANIFSTAQALTWDISDSGVTQIAEEPFLGTIQKDGATMEYVALAAPSGTILLYHPVGPQSEPQPKYWFTQKALAYDPTDLQLSTIVERRFIVDASGSLFAIEQAPGELEPHARLIEDLELKGFADTFRQAGICSLAEPKFAQQ